ncbi:MAG: CobD/CbiB family cobalamin biosynthesis protein, partial [Desulfovibrionaceae bacterium]|nr:CobD/CbiB family cobalamin biosynthesis protein [Desulfovibrionaceae bacterium]
VENLAPEHAREALSWLVSRDTSQMDRPLMRKTLADTLSENFTDALMAPFFWLLLTGPVGLWLYKAVSTTDSMWGYLTVRWRWLGWAGARGDDLLAFIPARLSAVLLWLTDALLRRFRPAARCWSGAWPGLRVVARQAGGMPSPNSGWSMAACAWLCGARMAGPSVYFGHLVDKPWLGPSESGALLWDEGLLRGLCALMRAGAALGGLALCCCAWLVRLFF